jgi:anti-sigma-K factor RskA
VTTAESHPARRDELAAYALGALEPAEAEALERHVDECRECREYLLWLDPAVSVLPASVEQRPAPARLKRALMAEVEADLKAARRAERDRERANRGFWGAFWRPVTAVAACLVLIAGLVAGYALRGDDEPESDLIAAEPLEPGSGAMAATLERTGDRGILHVEELPPLPANRVYQAWIGRDGAMEPSTTFVVPDDGNTEVAIEGSLDGASGLFITSEPGDGSDTPTPPILMEAPLS